MQMQILLYVELVSKSATIVPRKMRRYAHNSVAASGGRGRVARRSRVGSAAGLPHGAEHQIRALRTNQARRCTLACAGELS